MSDPSISLEGDKWIIWSNQIMENWKYMLMQYSKYNNKTRDISIDFDHFVSYANNF